MMAEKLKKALAFVMALLMVAALASCGGEPQDDPQGTEPLKVEVPEGKEEAYTFSGTWTDDEDTPYSYTLHCYTDQTLVLECHENQAGTWEAREDGSLALVIGEAAYQASKSELTGKYAFRFNDVVGGEEVAVTLQTVNSNVFEQKDIYQMIEEYKDRPGEIIFYGGSNFARWITLEKDLAEYPVQNKSISGSDDIQRYGYLQQLIYDGAPAIVLYMSSSNDWTTGRSVEEVTTFKEQIFDEMGETLPDTVFIILSATPNPLRYFGEYHESMIECDQWTKSYCESHDNFEFLDVVPALSVDNGAAANADIWGADRLHLTPDGYALLAEVVRDKLAEVCKTYAIIFD